MRSPSTIPILGGLAAALVAMVTFVPVAHAAPALTIDLGTELGGVLDDVSRTVALGGSACMEGLASIGTALGLDVHGTAVECHDLRGVGFAFLGLAAVVVIAVGRMRLATEQRRLDVARRLIERGMELPQGLLTAPARRDLRKGIVLVFAGLGLVIAGMMLGDRGMAAGGLIPAFIGIGYLISHRLATAEDEPSLEAELDPHRGRDGEGA